MHRFIGIDRQGNHMDAQGLRRNNLSLDGLNFFLADVRDGLGPYLAIYLLAVHHWDPASIGVVMTVAAIAGLITQRQPEP